MSSDHWHLARAVLDDGGDFCPRKFPLAPYFTCYLFRNEKHTGWTWLHLFSPPTLSVTKQIELYTAKVRPSALLSIFSGLSFLLLLFFLLPGLPKKGHRLRVITQRKADIYQCLWFGTLNGAADNFPPLQATVERESCVQRPKNSAGRLRVLPYVEAHRCQRAANVLNNATRLWAQDLWFFSPFRPVRRKSDQCSKC